MLIFTKMKVTTGILLLLMMIQSCPGIAMGYDILGGIRDYVSSEVKVSNEIINKNKLKITNSLKAGSGLLEQKKLEHVSVLENQVGQNSQNKLYQMQKKASLFMVGLEEGVLNGLGDLGVEFYSLGAKIPTAPERLINFGFNYSDNPQKYHQMVTNGALTVAGVLANPLPLLKQGKDAYLGAAKDPLKFGHLNGQGAAFVGTFFIGGTGVAKATSSAEKAEKAVQVGSAVNKAEMATQVTTTVNSAGKFTIAGKLSGLIGSLRSSPWISSPLVPLQRGFKNLLADQRAVMSFAPEGPSAAKIDLFVSGLGGRRVHLGSVENGVVKLNKEIDFAPKQLKALTHQGMLGKQMDCIMIRLGIEDLDNTILALVKNKAISVEDGIKCNGILDQAFLKTDDALGILQNEMNRIKEVRIYQDRDFKKLYSEGQLTHLEGDVLRQINTLKESETVSKGLLIEYKKLLGKVRIAQKELPQFNKGIGADDITIATLDKLMSEKVKWNLPKYYSPDDLKKLAGEIRMEKEYFIQDYNKVQELYNKGNKNMMDRMQELIVANWEHNELLTRINTVKDRMEKRLTGTHITESLLEKNLRETFTVGELEKLQSEVGKDIKFLLEYGAGKGIVSPHKILSDRISEAVISAQKTEREMTLAKKVVNPDDFLQGINLKGFTQSEIKQLEQKGKDLFKSLEVEETGIWQKYRDGQISVEKSIDLLAENYQKQDRLKAKLEILTKRYLDDQKGGM